MPWAHTGGSVQTRAPICVLHPWLFWQSCSPWESENPALFLIRAFADDSARAVPPVLGTTLGDGWLQKETAPAPWPQGELPARFSCCFPLTHASLLPRSICLCNSGLASHPAWHCLCQPLQMFRCGYLAGVSFLMAEQVE